MTLTELAVQEAFDRVRECREYRELREDAILLSESARWDEANESLDELDELFCRLTFEQVQGDLQASEFTEAVFSRLDRSLFGE